MTHSARNPLSCMLITHKLERSETMTTLGLHAYCALSQPLQVMWAHTAAAACHDDMKGRACWLSHNPGICDFHTHDLVYNCLISCGACCSCSCLMKAHMLCAGVTAAFSQHGQTTSEPFSNDLPSKLPHTPSCKACPASPNSKSATHRLLPAYPQQQLHVKLQLQLNHLASRVLSTAPAHTQQEVSTQAWLLIIGRTAQLLSSASCRSLQWQMWLLRCSSWC